jgi:hypothetical protein
VAEFSFVAPIQPGKTDAWRKAVDEIKGSRNAAYKESRRQHGIKREHVSLQSTPMGDLVVVHMDAPGQQEVMRGMMQGTSDFDTWFRETVLVGVHGFDPKAPTASASGRHTGPQRLNLRSRCGRFTVVDTKSDDRL